MLSILVCHSYFLNFDRKQQQRAKPYPPLATLQVASMLRAAGHEVSFFDAMLAEDLTRFERQLDVLRPQLVLFYEDNFNFLSKMCLGRMRRAACEMLTLARSRGARLLAAGSDASDAPEKYLAAGAHAVLHGEALATLSAMIERLDHDLALADGAWVAGLPDVSIAGPLGAQRSRAARHRDAFDTARRRAVHARFGPRRWRFHLRPDLAGPQLRLHRRRHLRLQGLHAAVASRPGDRVELTNGIQFFVHPLAAPLQFLRGDAGRGQQGSLDRPARRTEPRSANDDI